MRAGSKRSRSLTFSTFLRSERGTRYNDCESELAQFTPCRLDAYGHRYDEAVLLGDAPPGAQIYLPGASSASPADPAPQPGGKSISERTKDTKAGYGNGWTSETDRSERHFPSRRAPAPHHRRWSMRPGPVFGVYSMRYKIPWDATNQQSSAIGQVRKWMNTGLWFIEMVLVSFNDDLRLYAHSCADDALTPWPI